MSCQSGKERPGSALAKTALGKPPRRLHRLQSKARKIEWMARPTRRTQNVLAQFVPLRCQGRKYFSICKFVRAERISCRLDRSFQQNCRAVVQRMRESRARLDPFKAVLVKRQCSKKRRADGQRINGGTKIMDITGPRQLRRANAAAGAFVRLKYRHRLARLSHNDCRGKSVRTRADNHGVVGGRLSHATVPCLSHEDNPRSEHTARIYSPAQKIRA